MNQQTISRIIRLGYTNFWRNRWLTLGATLLMALTLTMISVSLLMSFVIRDTAQTIRSKIDLTIYFRDDTVTDQKITDLETRINEITGVVSSHFVNKQEALAIFDRLPINEDIKAPLSNDNNPLPRSIQISTSNPDNIQTVIASVERADSEAIICSDCVSYAKNKATVDQLLSITRSVQIAGIILSVLFGLIAVFNVMNIIRITIISRSDEIEIMRYVGASNAFVRGPFVVEGVLYGVLGTVFTTLLLLIISFLATRFFHGAGALSGSAITILGVNLFTYVLNHLLTLILAQLVLGLVLGIFVSLFSLRRYLRA
ncbi:MAG TPA: permease-like cell division protein FtsX [Candidatus Saccharimonadales bacterium]|nr:permease-like cell division protein FtsX [Candidatus Saccharimonadales bacterium]